ncbi:mannan endo-1,4-beta-mannosidase 5-like [Trifolium pratense]|uniref:mannan endo-1,4-beta-mannosidase 5-like n=1 Tax=Trifolium pratense TaxID=57577 RepID=UPI001E6947A7|nr:mannan endo-1,4-beta-mannosidase 5-like [Trifolium pratense]
MTSIIRNLISAYMIFHIIISNLVCEARLIRVTPSFVERKGTEFVLNGSPFLFNGFNSYWMMNVASDPNERYKVSNVFREASAAGLTICRTWAFSDGGNQSLQISPGIYNENVFQALDFVIGEAKKNGVRLILSLVNNYKDFGGRPQYVQWANSSGVQVNNDDDFYTNPIIKGYYKNHVKSVLTRINTITKITYKDEPTIMAWELINEPRCQVDYSGKTINAWVEEMAPYVKSIDKKHLLEVGLEGFYGDSISDRKQYNPGFQVGSDFVSNNLVKEIDFATIHAYPDSWLTGQNDTVQMEFMQKWMTSHLEDSRTILKKPLVFTEFGKSKNDPGYDINSRDSFMNAVYSSIYGLAQNGGTFAGGLVWQLLDEGMDSYNDGYEIVLTQNSSTSNVISQQSSKMIALEHTLGNKH